MGRTRSIKPGFFINEELAELPCEARLLFIGLWTIADREGRLEDRPRKIKAEVFPYDDCDVDGLLGLLEGKDFVNRYRVDGQSYIEIRNFVKHQKPHPKEAPSNVPAPRDDAGESAYLKGSANRPQSARRDGNQDANNDDDDWPSREKTEPGGEKQEPGHEKTEHGHENVERSHEKVGTSHEKVGTSREKVGTSHEKAGMSREIPEKDRNGMAARGDKEGPGPEKPGLSIDKRIKGRDQEWEGEDGPVPEPDRKPERSAAGNGAIVREPGVRAVFEYWKARTGHADAKLTREREMKIRARLAEGYTIQQLKQAEEGCRGSPFHQGDNERAHRYDDITLICRSGSKVEQFIEMTREHGNERKQSSRRSNVKKIIEGLELVRARAAQSGDPGDDNQQGEGGMLAACTRAG